MVNKRSLRKGGRVSLRRVLALAAMLSRKHLDNAVSTRTDDVPAILAPHNAAHAFAAHWSVRRDVLGTLALFERPEAD